MTSSSGNQNTNENMNIAQIETEFGRVFGAIDIDGVFLAVT